MRNILPNSIKMSEEIMITNELKQALNKEAIGNEWKFLKRVITCDEFKFYTRF